MRPTRRPQSIGTARLVAYLAEQQRILDRYETAAGKDKNVAMRDLATHAQDHRDLIDQITAHATRHGTDTTHDRR